MRTTVGGQIALHLENVRHRFDGRGILDGVDLAVATGSSLAITGPSGSGKTTLLLCMAGLLVPDSGTIRLGDQPVNRLSPAARAALRLRSVGVVYQFGELLPELSPVENVALPALLAGVPRDKAYRRAGDLLGDLGVGDKATVATTVLSGGERQRVAVARALVTEPALLLADEPTGSLDPETTGTVAALLYDLPHRYDCAVVVVTHNQQVAMGADRQMALRRGVLVEGSD